MTRAQRSFRRGLWSDSLPAAGRPGGCLARRGAGLALAAGLLLLALAPAGLSAQRDTTRTGGVTVNPAEPPHATAGAPDFLFARPKGAVTLRLGGMFPRAGSDVFSFSEQELTLKHSDFYAPFMGVDFAFRVAPRVDALLGVGYTRSSTRTNPRGYDSNDGFPIEERTRFAQVPLTVGLKGYLTPRGRQIGHFAWVPRKVTPFVGVAGGLLWHRFVQSGEFIDTQDSACPDACPIFNATYVSDSWTKTVQVLGGTDVTLGRHTALTLEARYGWGSADMGGDFVDFQKIDLAGLQTTVGFSLVF